MTFAKAWTTQQLTRLSLWLARAFGADATQPTATGATWNAETLANFGLQMSKGFGSGL
jgi:hypothetical protein